MENIKINNKNQKFIENYFSYSSLDENFFEKNTLTLEKELKILYEDFYDKMPPNSKYKLYSNKKFKKDFSIYSGTGGNIYIYWRYLIYEIAKEKKNSFNSKEINKNSPMLNAFENFEKSLEANFKLFAEYYDYEITDLKDIKASNSLNFKFEEGESTAFFHGPMGILTMSAIYFLLKNDEKNFIKFINEILNFRKIAINNNSEDELLYGNAGYLYSLMLIYNEIILFEKNFYEILLENIEDINTNKKIDLNTLDKICLELKKTIWEVLQFLHKVGSIQAQKNSYDFKFLIFPFPRNSTKNNPSNIYLGGAHGVAGNLYQMLKALNILKKQYESKETENFLMEKDKKNYEIILKDIKASLIELNSIKFQSGNFPSSYYGKNINQEKDKLVHFCHGAPGFVSLYSFAFNFYNDILFKKIAEECGEVIAQRGLLKKGFGTCHGITGNTYFLHRLYKDLKDLKYKKYFVDFLFFNNKENKEAIELINSYDDKGRKTVGVPDTPYSLMEGIGGRICLLSEILADFYLKEEQGKQGILKDFDCFYSLVNFPGFEV